MDFEAIARRAVDEFGARQDPVELAEFLRWLSDLRPQPKFVVEIGVYRGGNLWAMQQVVPQATFIGVDVTYKRLAACDFKSGTVLVCGESSKVKQLIRSLYDPSEAIVYIDGNHKYESVSRDADGFPGRYQIFHDVKDNRRAHEKRLVCHFYQENLKEFTHTISRHADCVGIGIRECRANS